MYLGGKIMSTDNIIESTTVEVNEHHKSSELIDNKISVVKSGSQSSSIVPSIEKNKGLIFEKLANIREIAKEKEVKEVVDTAKNASETLFKEVNEAVGKIEEDRDFFKEALDKAIGKLGKSKEKINQRKKEIEQYQTSMTGSISKLKDLNEEIGKLKENSKGDKEEIEQKKEEIEQKKEEIKQKELEIETKTKEYEELNSAKKTEEGKVLELQQKGIKFMEETKEKLTFLGKKVSEKLVQIFTKDVLGNAVDFTGLSNFSDITSFVDNFSKTFEKAVDSLKSHLDEITKERDELSEENKKLKEKIEKAEKEDAERLAKANKDAIELAHIDYTPIDRGRYSFLNDDDD
jgi:chromosome segregation ATPase